VQAWSRNARRAAGLARFRAASNNASSCDLVFVMQQEITAFDSA